MAFAVFFFFFRKTSLQENAKAFSIMEAPQTAGKVTKSPAGPKACNLLLSGGISGVLLVVGGDQISILPSESETWTDWNTMLN